MRHLALFALLLPAGCAMLAAKPPPDTAAMTPQQACTAQAENDPRVRELKMLIMTDSSGALQNLQPELVRARRRTVDDCLSRQGIAVPGGVAAVNPR